MKYDFNIIWKPFKTLHFGIYCLILAGYLFAGGLLGSIGLVYGFHPLAMMLSGAVVYYFMMLGLLRLYQSRVKRRGTRKNTDKNSQIQL